MGALVLAVTAAGGCGQEVAGTPNAGPTGVGPATSELATVDPCTLLSLSLIHISEPTRPY